MNEEAHKHSPSQEEKNKSSSEEEDSILNSDLEEYNAAMKKLIWVTCLSVVFITC
jgi:hypothetical protein